MVLQVCDALMHIPFVEDKNIEARAQEMERFIQSLLIASGMLMVVGQRFAD